MLEDLTAKSVTLTSTSVSVVLRGSRQHLHSIARPQALGSLLHSSIFATAQPNLISVGEDYFTLKTRSSIHTFHGNSLLFPEPFEPWSVALDIRAPDVLPH
jgi:hypothetical protein